MCLLTPQEVLPPWAGVSSSLPLLTYVPNAAGDPVSAEHTHQPIAQLSRILVEAGWDILYLDIDFSGDHSRLNLQILRADGRLLHARTDARGRGAVDRYWRATSNGHDLRAPGGMALSPEAGAGQDVCTGGIRYGSVWDMLRGLTSYIAYTGLRSVCPNQLLAAWEALAVRPVRAGELPGRTASHTGPQ